MRKGPVKPTGKGFSWPKEYYPSNSVFYDLSILYQGVGIAGGVCVYVCINILTTDENPASSDASSIDNILGEEGNVDDSSISNTLKYLLIFVVNTCTM